ERRSRGWKRSEAAAQLGDAVEGRRHRTAADEFEDEFEDQAMNNGKRPNARKNQKPKPVQSGANMATQLQSKAIHLEDNIQSNLESDLALEMLRVVEAAAIASAREMGTGDRKKADQVATETMRHVMETVPMRGTIVIGEGERDEAPMLYIGEKVGRPPKEGIVYPEVDIA